MGTHCALCVLGGGRSAPKQLAVLSTLALLGVECVGAVPQPLQQLCCRQVRSHDLCRSTA